MNRLRNKAIKDFCSVSIISIVALLSFGILTCADIKGAKGAMYLCIALLYTGISIGWMFFRNNRKRKKQLVPEFDEREFYLIHRAINIGNNIFIAFVLLTSIISFYLVGGRGAVPMWSIPVIFFCGIFISATIQTLILMHYAKEDDE